MMRIDRRGSSLSEPACWAGTSGSKVDLLFLEIFWDLTQLLTHFHGDRTLTALFSTVYIETQRTWSLAFVSAGSVLYFNSTTKTSPRQSVPTVQAAAPDSEPSVPIQSEEKMKNLPSCEMVPMAQAVLKRWEWVVVKS